MSFKRREDAKNPGCRIKVKSWSVQSLYQTGNVCNTITAMPRIDKDLLGLNDLRYSNVDSAFLRTIMCIIQEEIQILVIIYKKT